MFSDANRFIQLDRDAVGRVVRPIRGRPHAALTRNRSAIRLHLNRGPRSKVDKAQIVHPSIA
jgi:hypothetical protein